MNVFALFPLIAFFANISMFCYIYYSGIERKLNKLYILFALSLAIWSLGDFIYFTVTVPNMAFFGNYLSTIGACFTVAFLLHFFIIFTKNKLFSNKIYLILFYLPALFFLFINFTTNLITESAEPAWWGYYFERGILYIPYTLYLVLYVILGFFLCFKYYPKSTLAKEKTQTKLLILAVTVPLVGGIATQIIPVVFGLKMIPLTSVLTTVTAIIIAYAIVKHKLMATGSFSIYRKLVGSFLIIIILVLSVGFFSAGQSRELLEKSIGEGSSLLVYDTMSEINRTVYGMVEEFQIQVDSNNYGFQELVKKSNREFSLLGSEQDIYDYIIEKDMKWVNTPENETISLMDDIFDNNMSRRLKDKIEFHEEKYSYRLFGEIFVTNKYGANVGQTGRTSDYYQADEEWWQYVREDGLYLGEVGYDQSADIFSIDVVVRIDNENGDFIGVLKAVWDIENIFRIMENSKLSEKNNHYGSVRCFLLDHVGRLIYSTEKFEFLENKSNMLPFLIEFSGEEESFSIVSDINYDESEKLVAHAHLGNILNIEGLDWILIMDYDTEDIFASISNLWNAIMIASFIVAIISLSFGYIISRSISKPIIKLRDFSKEIGIGNLDINIDIHSKDEVGELATTFRKMTNDLKKSRNKLSSEFTASSIE